MKSKKNNGGITCIDCGKYVWHADKHQKRCADYQKTFNLIRASDYYKKNIEKIKAYQKNYREENKKAA